MMILGSFLFNSKRKKIKPTNPILERRGELEWIPLFGSGAVIVAASKCLLESLKHVSKDDGAEEQFQGTNWVRGGS